MTDINFRSDMTVHLVDHMGNDDAIIKAAKVSTIGDGEVGEMSREAREKFINFLVANRHGSPFESVTFKFMVSAPIFVWREIQRHRMAAYSEESARYKKLQPVFYVPDGNRKLKQEGKPGEYKFVAGDATQREIAKVHIRNSSTKAYASYEAMLNYGIAREVARMVLPLNIYSTAYVTMNLRALTNFLSLRVQSEGATFPSYPQREIEMVAEKMEDLIQPFVPIAMKAFRYNGRVPL